MSFPPPPPPSPIVKKASTPPPPPKRPDVVSNGAPGEFLVELLVYNGSPFKDHWAYFVCSHGNRDVGVKIHATGTVASGFEFEAKRSCGLEDTQERPTERIPLQWVDARHFDEKAILNHGTCKEDGMPVCGFEISAHKARVPGKTLNSADDTTQKGKKIAQKDCQSWVVEAAEFLVQDCIFNPEVADYLRAIKQ